jgi:peptidyl-prolyl cis-trans isomerase SurA
MQNPIDMSQRVRKLILFPALTIFFCSTLTAQTLFTCDGRDVSKEDFLRAYNKNNSKEKATAKSYRDYLELYIRYKLKVRSAYAMQLDTLAGQKTELQNFRSQIAENYMKDDESLEKLVNEVYTRGQKDVHLAHIFFAIPRNASPADTLKVYEKARAAYNALKKGKNFHETALAWSDDPAVQHNEGDLGYIGIFTLPYDLETLAYSTLPGQFSKPFRSKAGYHIFKNEGERKSLGRIKVAQILVAFPPGAAASVKETIRLKADSIYDSLVKGADFGQQAKLYSGDNLTYQNQGELPEFGIGRYDSAFEAAAFALDKDGAISQPVLTAYGYHIIKRLSRKPFSHQFTKETAAMLKQQVMSDPRIEVSRKALLQKILHQTGFRQSDFAEADLFAFTDSAITNRALTSFRGLTNSTVLFTFPKQQYTIKDWLDHARVSRTSKPNGGNRTDEELFRQYLEKVALDYYRNHLEEYNPDFAYQVTEFKEGNLLFEVMQRKIWDKASTDSAGLRNFYETHKDKYWWESSADAILFTCNNMKTAEGLKKGLDNHQLDWKQLADSAGAAVQADSGRYEWTQIPAPDKKDFRPVPGMITPFTPNKMDNTVSFAYILQVYNERSPRNYRDARGFVINDYQSALEDQWIADLRKKYPVNVDERVLASLPR